MPPEQAAASLEEVPAAAAAGALALMTPAAAAACLRIIREEPAAELIRSLSEAAAVRILRGLEEGDRERLLAAAPDRAGRLRRLARYAEGTAGAFMDPEVGAWPEDLSASEVRSHLRRDARRLRYYLYVTDREQRLLGVLTLRQLTAAPAGQTLGSLMHRPVEHLGVRDGRRAVVAHPGWRRFAALPVTESSGILAGVLTYEAVRRLEWELAAEGSTDLADLGASLGEAWVKVAATLLAGVAGGLLAAREEEPGHSRRSAGGESHDEAS
jgi:magnesium transporter